MDYGIARRAIIGEQKHRWVNNDRFAGDVNRNYFILIAVRADGEPSQPAGPPYSDAGGSIQSKGK